MKQPKHICYVSSVCFRLDSTLNNGFFILSGVVLSWCFNVFGSLYRESSIVLISSEMWTDHLPLANSCTMLVLKICSGFKEAWKLLKRR